MANSKKIFTFALIGILAVLTIWCPLFVLVLIPVVIGAWKSARSAPSGGGQTQSAEELPRPTGPRPAMDVLDAPFPEVGNNFKVHVPRANRFLRGALGMQDYAIELRLLEMTGPIEEASWYECLFAPGTTPKKGLVRVLVLPFGIQAFEIDTGRLGKGILPSVDEFLASGEPRSGSSAPMEGDLSSLLQPGSGFSITRVECGAAVNENGIRIAFEVQGTGDVGNPKRHEDIPFLFVVFVIGEREDCFLAPCVAAGRAEWRFDEVFFRGTGVTDFAGEIFFAAQIANHRGSELTPESITPRSPAVTGIVRARSATMPL